MRPTFGRVLAAVLLSGVTLVSASACTRVNLTDQWPTLAEPTGWEPKAGVCSADFAETSYRAAYKPVDCGTKHVYETVFIGQFKSDAGNTPPARNSATLRAAWSECDAKSTEYLGGDWRGGKVWVSVSVPSKGNWEGGARWFRCEIAALNKNWGETREWSKSLKGEFAKDSELKFGCYQVPDKSDAEVVEKKCNESHNAEYVGTFIANESRDDLKNNKDTVHQKCRSLIAGYVGVPDDGNLKYRTGSYYTFPGQDDWDEGDHGVRCHLYLQGKTFTSSLKGGGAKALPIN